MTFLISLEILSIVLYGGLFWHSWRALSASKPLGQLISKLLILAILLHGAVAYLKIDGGHGQDFGLFNILVMTTWIAMVIVYWNLIRHESHALLLISLPVAALSLLEVALLSKSMPIQLQQNGIDIWHILLGIGSMSILMLAAMQSILVLYIDRGLRHHPASIHAWLGPLQSMERFLIQLLSSGFVLMTLSLGLAFFYPIESSSNQSLHKIILTLLSWLILGGLLLGHYKRGWRGVFAAKWTLLGVFLLLLGYFGSKLVLEFILNR